MQGNLGCEGRGRSGDVASSIVRLTISAKKYVLFFCLGVYFVIIMIIPAGDDPRGGGHVRHVQDPALGRQTESEHLGRDREVRVFVFMARPYFRSGNITFFQANNLYCRHLDKVKLQEDFTKALTNQTS